MRRIVAAEIDIRSVDSLIRTDTNNTATHPALHAPSWHQPVIF